MPIVAVGRSSWSLGAIIALFVAIASFVLMLVGGASTFVLLGLILALAIAVLMG